ncbi:MAG: tetratricopeptide repeat protein [Cyanobacteria bacterium P01_G01_bin.54]
MQRLHLDLRPVQSNTYELRCFAENANQYREPRRLQTRDIQAWLERADLFHQAQLDHQVVGRVLFDWLDGEEGWLRQALAQNPDGTVLAIAAAERLANLPWEVLHDGTDFLVNQLPTVVPVRWVRPENATGEMALGWAEQPDNRALNVLFMATEPEGAPSLSFEAEEGRILTATARQPLNLTVEESGCLEELAAVIQASPEPFDVFHLTGHAGLREEGARFATETATGQLYPASGRDLAQVWSGKLPRLLFVSGCHTGQSLSATPSLAEALIQCGAGAVLGWGQSVLDRDATAAAAELYKGLAAGLTVTTALAHVYRALLAAKARDWHLLRLYVRGQLPGALVTPLRTRGRKQVRVLRSATQFLDPATQQVKVPTRESFVGRRRVLQAGLRVLLQPGDGLGVLLHGMGGLGKSSVAARLCDRLRGYQPIVWVGRLDAARLVRQLAEKLDDRELREMLQDPGEGLKFRLRRLFAQLPDDLQFILVWDDFEAGNVEPQGEGYRLTPEARGLWAAVKWAIEETRTAHRVIVTCRYQVAMAGLVVQPLDSLKGSDLQKKCQQLEAFKLNSAVEAGLQMRAQGLADGNPRLLEWLDKVLRDPPQPPLVRGELESRELRDPPQPPLVRGELDLGLILDRLAANPVKLREQVLADELLARVDEPLRRLLSRGLVFELPVPRGALVAVAEVGDAAGLIERAVALGLLEVSPDEGMRVPRVLPLVVPEDEVLAGLAARVLYRLWWEEADSPEEVKGLEVHRLAMAGKEGKIAAKLAGVFSRRWKNRSRFRDSVALCRSTLEIVDDHLVTHELARSEQELGEVKSAQHNYQKALKLCPEEDETEKAAIIHNLAGIYANQGKVEAAIALYQQSLETTKKIGDVKTQAATLHQMAIIYANQGQVDEAIALYQQSLETTEKIGDVQSKAATLGQMAHIYEAQGDMEKAFQHHSQAFEIAKEIGHVQYEATALHCIAGIYTNQGKVEEALALYQQSLEIKEKIGDVQGKAATLHQMAGIYAKQGKVDEAIALYQQSLEIKEKIGNVQGKAATLHQMAIIYANQGKVDEAIALYQQSLEIQEKIGNVQGKAATLHQMAGIYANQGKVDEAIALYQQSVGIEEKIGNVQGKAATLAMMGQLLAAARQDYAQGLAYLAESLQILVQLKSPDAQTVQRIIARIEGNAQRSPQPQTSPPTPGFFGRLLQRFRRIP